MARARSSIDAACVNVRGVTTDLPAATDPGGRTVFPSAGVARGPHYQTGKLGRPACGGEGYFLDIPEYAQSPRALGRLGPLASDMGGIKVLVRRRVAVRVTHGADGLGVHRGGDVPRSRTRVAEQVAQPGLPPVLAGVAVVEAEIAVVGLEDAAVVNPARPGGRCLSVVQALAAGAGD